MKWKAIAAAAGKRAPAVVRDLAGLAGCGLVSAGAGMIYPPAGLIVGGLFLMAGAFLSAKAGS
jgi:hypothetical protein